MTVDDVNDEIAGLDPYWLPLLVGPYLQPMASFCLGRELHNAEALRVVIEEGVFIHGFGGQDAAGLLRKTEKRIALLWDVLSGAELAQTIVRFHTRFDDANGLFLLREVFRINAPKVGYGAAEPLDVSQVTLEHGIAYDLEHRWHCLGMLNCSEAGRTKARQLAYETAGLPVPPLGL